MEARVIVSGGSYNTLTKLKAADLEELLGVSQAQVGVPAFLHGMLNHGATELTVNVFPADGKKCERCWRYTTDVAADPNYPTVCQRCAEALTAIAFSPYPNL